MPLVVILSVPFLVILASRPVLRRLALRYASRRPRETMLVLLGSLLGTAIITGSFVVGDTLDASIRRSAFTQLGPVDEVVRAPVLDVVASAAPTVRSAGGADVDGVLPVGVVDAAVSTVGPNRKAEPNAQVYEVDFGAARNFGGDSQATGMDGPTPGQGEAAIGDDLSRALGVGLGDRIVVYAYGTQAELAVVRKLRRTGIAGLSFERTSESPNLFVAPGTLAGLHARALTTEAPPPSALLLVSNTGGVVEGATRSDAVKANVERALAGAPVTVEKAKQSLLEGADEAGKEFAELFGGIGFFSVLAGVLLLVNIFVMLAQERKTELGMIRAMGLRRRGMVASFSLEGWLYALVASAIGTVAGLGVGRLIVAVAAGIFATGDFTIELRYAAELASIQQGFATGFVISLVTVLLTSLWVSRLNVIRAIRDLPEPETERRRVITLVLGAVAILVGGLVTSSGASGDSPYAILGGPAVAIFGAVPLLRRFVPRRALVSLASIGALLWAVVVFEFFPSAFENADIPVFVEQGVILTAAAVALVTQNQATIGAFVRRLGGSSNLALRIGLAYPLARRFRTGMILSMYALVVFTLTFITVFSHLFQGQIDDFTHKASGGFDLRVSSNAANPISTSAMAGEQGVDGVAEMAVVEAEWEARTSDGFEPWPVAGIDDGLVSRGGPALTDRDQRFADDQAAYRAVLADPSLVILNEFFLQQGGGPPEGTLKPGERVTLRDPSTGRTKQLTVAGLAEGGFANLFVYVARPTVDEVFAASATTNTWFVSTKPGTDADALADRINGRFLANGADADSFRKTVSDNLAQQEQFFRLMQGYLALGLVVGIAGLGVVMVRAVRERRRQVGILRSLGFEAGAVRRAFVAESAFIALEGILIGSSLAILTAWRLVSNATFGEGLAFSIPWAQLSVLVVGTFLASLLATATPAQQASKIRPAVALRLAD